MFIKYPKTLFCTSLSIFLCFAACYGVAAHYNIDLFGIVAQEPVLTHVLNSILIAACSLVIMLIIELYCPNFWDTLMLRAFWPIISDEYYDQKRQEAMAGKDTINAESYDLTNFLGGYTFKVHYLNQTNYCRIMTDEGQMYIVAGPDVHVKVLSTSPEKVKLSNAKYAVNIVPSRKATKEEDKSED